MAKLNLITDATELAKEGKLIINQIGSKGTIAKRIQRFLLSEISHIEEHRNPTRLNEFLANAKGGSVRVSAMRAYVLRFANVTEETETSAKTGKERNTGKLVMRKSRKPEVAKAEFEKACATDWLSFKPEKDETEYTIATLKADVVKLLSKAYAENMTEKQVLDAIQAVNAEAHKAATDRLAKLAAKAASDAVKAKATASEIAKQEA